MVNDKEYHNVKKPIMVFFANALSYVIYSNLIYLRAGLLWVETLIRWDNTCYIGLAKLILQDLTFFWTICTFLFPSLPALRIHINLNEYYWARAERCMLC